MTPTSETALEIGCVCTTTLMAHTTAISAKIRNRMTSMSGKPGDQEAGHQQVQYGDRKKALPGEAHQLVVAEARQRAADPDERKQNETHFRQEPEQRQKPALDHWQQEEPRNEEKDNSEGSQCQAVALPCGMKAVIQRHGAGQEEDHNRNEARTKPGRPRSVPPAEKQQNGH